MAHQSATNVATIILINTHLISEPSHLMLTNQIGELLGKSSCHKLDGYVSLWMDALSLKQAVIQRMGHTSLLIDEG